MKRHARAEKRIESLLDAAREVRDLEECARLEAALEQENARHDARMLELMQQN